MTNSEMLTSVETAISQLLSGNVQSYTIDGRSLTRLDLTQLYQMRRQLQAAVIRETNGGFSASQFRRAE